MDQSLIFTPRLSEIALSKTDIVIVNWNAGLQLRECIDSIFRCEDEALGQLIIVDNASRDGSVDFARGDPRIVLIEPGRNLGFGTACNLGAAQGKAPYILFLNPDTRFLSPTLEAVQHSMEKPEHSRVAVCGVRLVSENGAIARHCSRQPSALRLLAVSSGLTRLVPNLIKPLEMLEFDHEENASVPHLMGAYYQIRRNIFAEMKGFDNRFFVYYEDLDLSRRLLECGYKILYLASVSVFHRTAGTSRSAKAKALSYLLEGRLLFAEKHFGTIGRLLVRFGVYAVDPARRLVHSALVRDAAMRKDTIIAMRRLRTMRRGATVDRS